MLGLKAPYLKSLLCPIVIGILFLVHSCSKDKASSDDGTPNPTSEITAQNFGGSLNDNASAIVATTDGGYMVLGHTQSDDGDVIGKNNTSFDFWLLKFDAEGKLDWSKTFGGSGDDRGSDIVQTSDNGFVLVGYTTSVDGDITENAGAQDHWVVKVDANGTLLWQKSFGFSGRDEAISVIETKDTGLLVVGILDVTASNGEGSSVQKRHAGGDYWALKLDADGELQWRNFFGGTFTDTAYDVVETANGEFLVLGSSDSNDVDITNNKGTYDFWVVKIAANGNLVWEKNYGGSEIDEAYGILTATDGNYVIVGDTRSDDKDITSNNGGADVWVLKIDGDGEVIWEKTYGGSSFDVGRAITKSAKGGFLITGSSRSLDGDVENNEGQNDVWLIKIDENGTLEWQNTIGGTEIDFGKDVVELNNGTIVVVGETSSADVDIPSNNGFTDVLKIEIKR